MNERCEALSMKEFPADYQPSSYKELPSQPGFDGLRKLPEMPEFKPTPWEPLSATIEGEGTKVQLNHKASVRHPANKTITKSQAETINSAPENSLLLLLVNQLIGSLEHRLLPSEDKHPELWDRLQVLCDLTSKALKLREAAL
jgi:hypothetical protein